MSGRYNMINYSRPILLPAVIGFIFLTGITFSFADEIQPATPVSDTATGSTEENVQHIYRLDEEIRIKENELGTVFTSAEEAECENKFEKAHQLKLKAGELNEKLKDLKNVLAQRVKDYEVSFSQQAWWKQLVIEISAPYTFFDNDLNIDNGWGSKLKILSLKASFRRFYLGSYLYYPLSESANYPFHQVEAAPFIFEYRRFRTDSIASTKKEVEINSYLIGFGAFTQAWGNTYLNLNLAAGFQQYRGTEPDDNAPLVSYTLGLQQKILSRLSLGLEINEEAVWTDANQSGSHLILNFSSAFVIRFGF